MLKTFFFDFDGVLVDSAKIKAEGFFELLFPKYRAFESQIRSYVEIHGGVSRFEKFRYIYKEILEETLTEVQSKQLCDDYAELVLQRVKRAPEIKGVVEFLNKLGPQRRAYVVSGSPQIELRQIVSERAWGGIFVEVLGSPTPKVPLLASLIKAENISPKNAVFFGDSITDFDAASHSNVDFIGIGTPWENSKSNWFKDFCGIEPQDFER
jgi:phosphoglycolate phosphatase-like HAD superfamily hydrolase